MRTEVSGKTYNIRNELKGDGFRWDNNNKSWYKTHDSLDEYYNLRDKYKGRNGVKVKLQDSPYSRDALYRSRFFSRYQGGILGLYRCAYCGKILTKQNVTVDHIVPVSKAADSKKCRFFLKYFRAESVNSIENLTPACKRCNSKKGHKTGILYFLRGYSGKSSIGITVRRICEAVSIISAVMIIFEIIYWLGGG